MQAGIKSTIKFSSCSVHYIRLYWWLLKLSNTTTCLTNPLLQHIALLKGGLHGQQTCTLRLFKPKRQGFEEFQFPLDKSHLFLPKSYKFLLLLGQSSLTEALSLEVPGMMECFSIPHSNEFMSLPCATSRIPTVPSWTGHGGDCTGSAKGACPSEMSLLKELLNVCTVIATKKQD